MSKPPRASCCCTASLQDMGDIQIYHKQKSAARDSEYEHYQNQTDFLSLNSKRHKLLNSPAWQSDPGPTKWLNDHVVIIGHSPFFLLDKFPHSAPSASGTFPYHIHSCTSALLWSV